jgi:mannose-6-phosphate isomerase-like protein (cupin superfamily)
MERTIVRMADLDEFPTQERCLITELWNRGDDRQVSVAQARIPRGVTTQLHALDGVDERYVVIAGSGWVELDGERHGVGPVDIVAIPAGTPQRARAGDEGDLVVLCVCTPPFTVACYQQLE